MRVWGCGGVGVGVGVGVWGVRVWGVGVGGSGCLTVWGCWARRVAG